jgi:hypothetical protein
MRALLAFFSIALVAAGTRGYGHANYHASHPYVDTRAGCPPEGYVALAPNLHLDRLPSGGKYAICQTAAQAAAVADTDHLWTLTSGVFKLRNSELIVDANVKINFQYPSRPDWTEVAVKGFDGDTETGIDEWRGVTVRGAPSDELLESAHHPHWPVPFGNCGSFDTVVIDNVENDEDSLTLDHCSKPTSVKKLTTFTGCRGLMLMDSSDIIVQDSFFAGDTQNNRRRGESVYSGFDSVNSLIGFVNLAIYGQGDNAVQIEDGSHITICNLFKRKVGTTFTVKLGAIGDDMSPSSLALAGVTNIYLPRDLQFEGDGGVVFTIGNCPDVLSDNYDMSLWGSFFTATPAYAG